MKPMISGPEFFLPGPYVEREEVENYLGTLKDRGSTRVEEFFDNSIVSELDCEGFIDTVYKRKLR
jgi:hypothetical protein